VKLRSSGGRSPLSDADEDTGAAHSDQAPVGQLGGCRSGTVDEVPLGRSESGGRPRWPDRRTVDLGVPPDTPGSSDHDIGLHSSADTVTGFPTRCNVPSISTATCGAETGGGPAEGGPPVRRPRKGTLPSQLRPALVRARLVGLTGWCGCGPGRRRCRDPRPARTHGDRPDERVSLLAGVIVTTALSSSESASPTPRGARDRPDPNSTTNLLGTSVRSRRRRRPVVDLATATRWRSQPAALAAKRLGEGAVDRALDAPSRSGRASPGAPPSAPAGRPPCSRSLGGSPHPASRVARCVRTLARPSVTAVAMISEAKVEAGYRGRRAHPAC